MHVPALEYTSSPDVTPQPDAVPSATEYDTTPVPDPPAEANVTDSPNTNDDADVTDNDACAA